MIVYVESNYILELAFHQEQHAACAALLTLAQAGSIQLVLPSYSVGESYERWTRRAKQRKNLNDDMQSELNELSRSEQYNDEANQKKGELTLLLVNSIEAEKRELDQTLSRLVDCAQLIHLDGSVLKESLVLQTERGLSPQDAIVYASVLAHLRVAPDESRCFITRNSRDFSTPDIETDLNALNCKLLTNFPNGLGYIQSVLRH